MLGHKNCLDIKPDHKPHAVCFKPWERLLSGWVWRWWWSWRKKRQTSKTRQIWMMVIIVTGILISNRSTYCNQRLSNIYSHVYLRILSPSRPYQALTTHLLTKRNNLDFQTFSWPKVGTSACRRPAPRLGLVSQISKANNKQWKNNKQSNLSFFLTLSLNVEYVVL